MPAVSYALEVDGAPASAELLAAVRQVEVEEHAELAAMLRIGLAVGVRDDGAGWTVLDDDLFTRLAPVKLTVAVGSSTRVPLVEGRVVEADAEFSNEPGRSTLEVVAMDASVLMNLEEKIRAWPDMADSDIAATLFGEYGLEVDVEPTSLTRRQDVVTVIQRGTDFQFLRRLATRNGYECFVTLDPSTGAATGHFHPPRLQGPPAGVLNVNMGSTTNVNAFRARFEMLRPTAARLDGVDFETGDDQSAEVRDPSLEPLGGTRTHPADRPRVALPGRIGLVESAELQAYAQAVVDRSSWAIVAEGELNTAAFGGILRARQTVFVRGAGRNYSGAYYVERVLHAFTGDGYTQRFTLRRNALGLTRGENFAADDALAE
ncbi:MAG: contractile injection system protein, VgrG/Pvc8 family [Isosphaeraceae bacterium]